MIRSAKVLWGEGLLLRPQHFQRQDAYHEWRLAQTALALHPYAWGLRSLDVDHGALASGSLRVLQFQAVFPDGDICFAPHGDELPETISLTDIPASQVQVEIFLALAPMRAAGSNYSTTQNDARASARFLLRDETGVDWFTSAVASPVQTLHRRPYLITNPSKDDRLSTIPLLRLRRRSSGGFEVDTRFVPPALSIAAAPALQSMLDGLLKVLHAKVEALHGLHREPSKNVIEFRSGDIASFWLLHTCGTAYAGLIHLHKQPLFHPERLFERMLELAGALMTFSKKYQLDTLPIYAHNAPEKPFEQLDAIVRELLETVISTRSFAIPLSPTRASYYQGPLTSEKINSNTRFYLGVQANMQPSELVEAIPIRCKVGASEDVERAVLAAIAGVTLTHAPQVPMGIPVRPGHYYFALDTSGALHQRMLQAQSITVYAPSTLENLHLELFALNDE